MLLNWRIIAAILGLAGSFGAGWHTHTLSDAYHAQKATQARLDATSKANGAIVDFNQKWSDAHAQDDCLSKPIPDSLVRLLK